MFNFNWSLFFRLASCFLLLPQLGLMDHKVKASPSLIGYVMEHTILHSLFLDIISPPLSSSTSGPPSMWSPLKFATFAILSASILWMCPVISSLNAAVLLVMWCHFKFSSQLFTSDSISAGSSNNSPDYLHFSCIQSTKLQLLTYQWRAVRGTRVLRVSPKFWVAARHARFALMFLLVNQ